MADDGKRSGSASAKARRGKNLNSRLWKKLRHILKRNTVREAFEYANQHACLAILKQLCPDYQKRMGNSA